MLLSKLKLPLGSFKPKFLKREFSEDDIDELAPIRTPKRVSRSTSDATSTNSIDQDLVDLTNDDFDHHHPISTKKIRLRPRSSRGADSASSSNHGDESIKYTEHGKVSREGQSGAHGSVEYSEDEGPNVTGSSFIVAIPPPLPRSSRQERFEVEKGLQCLGGPPVLIVNQIDDSSPPTEFVFIEDHVLGEGVEKLTDDFMIGCECRDENGRNCGCEYRYCGCLQESARDEKDEVHFPYSVGRRNYGALRQIWLQTRWHIFECNQNCNCKSNCKNKVVQKGRQIPLEIFKTTNRGWGLRCPKDIIKGQFIDTYRGEIITNDEAERRGEERGQDSNNYLMDLDKFCEKYVSPEELKETMSIEAYRQIRKRVRDGEHETKPDKDGKLLWLNPSRMDHYVCDSRIMGGPTKFMNHSCMPNCRIFTVSYNHADRKVYDIAFFAVKNIPAFTELTFDYKDEDDRSVITDERALELKEELGFMPIPCLCGSRECRKYFFN